MMSATSFSRGALEMTFQILKMHHPRLALTVRNILDGSRDNAGFFHVNLSKPQISEVIVALEQDLESIDDVGMRVVAVSLLNDWKQIA